MKFYLKDFKSKRMEFGLIAAVCTVIVSTHLVSSTHPDCLIVLHLLQKEDECKVLKETSHNKTSGCVTQWDGVSCWPDASEGDVVSVQCPALLLRPGTSPGAVSRKCTERGWSRPDRSYHQACNSAASQEGEEDDDVRTEKTHLDAVKLIYSVGYGLSLAALLIAALVFCCFRKLLCTRNLVHLHLFASFMLRSLSVFVKDAVLFSDQSTDHCTVSTWRCQAAVSFSHFSVVSNFLWLLLEALNLHTLLLFSFTQTRKLLWIYTAVGWGTPAVTVLIWALLKKHLDDEGCWDDLDSRLWWIIKTPILLCICINFLIFLNISRIIAQKTKATAVTQSETHLYRTLLRSTLLLVPLFGLHYVVFALFPDHVGVRPRLYLELVLGSFQGFLVAVLFCFLNGEVQTEIRKLLRSCRPEANNINMNMNMNMNLPTQEDAA